MLSRRQFLKVLTAGIGGGLLTGSGLWRLRSLRPPDVFKETRSLLGTFITITVHDPDGAKAREAMAKAFAAVQKVDAVMSIHRLDSDLSLVNGHAGNEMISVDPSLIDILKTAEKFYALTGGIYDVTCLPLMQLYGFYSSGGRRHHYPSDRMIGEVLERTGQRHVRFDEKSNRVGLTRTKAGIDLGSIGKGYAVDLAGDVLKSFGIKNALIDAGGNILGLGAPYGDEDPAHGWRVAIRNPNGGDKKPYFEKVTLRDAAVATSGNYEQVVWLDGRRVGHLLNAKNGRPSELRIASATAVAKNAALADALSTSTFLMGPEAQGRFKGLATAIYYHGETHFFTGWDSSQG